jgi:RNA polymerase sigma factor (sigma-70 family)
MPIPLADNLPVLLEIAQKANLDIANTDSIYNKNHGLLSQIQEEKVFEILHEAKSTKDTSSEEKDVCKMIITLANSILVLANIRLIHWAMKSLHGHYEDDEILQEGVVALQRAIAKFDPKKEVRFTTYASYWLKEANLRLFKAKFPHYQSSHDNAAKESELENEFLNLSKQESQSSIPFEDEMCIDTSTISQMDELEKEEIHLAVLSALDHLTPLEKQVVLFTYGFIEEGIKDNVELAKSLGVSISDIYKAMRSAKNKLKNHTLLKELYL